VTYPDPAIQNFIADHFVPVRLTLSRPQDQAHFRAHRVIWTPTVLIMDRKGAAHYQSPGYLPPDLFLPMLQIELARALTAWSRYDEAALHLNAVANNHESPWAPEALFWLGIAWFLQTRRRATMMQAWNRLRMEYPASIWAARVPPNQESEPEGDTMIGPCFFISSLSHTHCTFNPVGYA